jgi:thiamine pyrophosphate-dependent acetolactate synthase large subunit-like protein
MANRKKGALDRREVVKAILEKRKDTLVVTGLGSSSYDVGVHDDPNTFYLWGAMGAAAMVGLGLALAQPKRRVLVVTGDGEMLMGLGSLATIGPERPRNLSIVVLDNESYGETGMQRSHTGRGVDLAAIARGAAFPAVTTVFTMPELEAWLPTIHGTEGPVLTVIKVTRTQPPARVPLRDGTHIKIRFREALLGPETWAG